MSQTLYSYKQKKGTIKEHILVAMVENKPGVLSKVFSLFRRRRFNVKSMTAGSTEKEHFYRLTIVIDGDQTNVEQVIKQLYKIIEVIKVTDVSKAKITTRELALIKIHTTKTNRLEVLKVAHVYRAKVVSTTKSHVIIEITGRPSKINSFVDMCKIFGIVELVRTGVVTMTR